MAAAVLLGVVGEEVLILLVCKDTGHFDNLVHILGLELDLSFGTSPTPTLYTKLSGS